MTRACPARTPAKPPPCICPHTFTKPVTMAADMTTPVIAVDGGGTRCRLVLARGDDRLAVEVGPANVTTDFDAALTEIRAGLDRLAEAAGLRSAAIAALPAYLGLAGVTDRALSARVEAALPFANVRVAEDRAAALAGALGAGDGAIAHCGTGLFFGLQRSGATRFIGGWGARLGDEASAFWLGRLALTETLAAVDGLRPHSPLSETLSTRWATPTGLVDFATTATPDAFARLAPEITAAASEGDTLGRHVMEAGAAHLADRLDRLGWSPDLPLCLTGGLAPAYAPWLPDSTRAAIVAPKAAPIEGAVLLARAFAAELAG